MGIFRYPLAAARGLAPLLADVDPARRLRVAAHIIFADRQGYSDAESRGLSPDEYARRIFDGAR